MRRSPNPIRHRRKFCQRGARFRQASAKLAGIALLFAFLRNSNVTREGTEIQRPCYLPNRDNFPNCPQQEHFFGGCALWRTTHPGSQQFWSPPTAVPKKKPSLFPELVATP